MSDGTLKPTLLPLGDGALLVRFAETLSEAANRAAIALARRLEDDLPEGVAEIAPGLVSVLLRLQPGAEPARVAGEVRLRLGGPADTGHAATHEVALRFDGEDVAEVADLLRLTVPEFIAWHNGQPLRVLATGFAPGFVYCGFHPPELVVPRRDAIRFMVPAGTVLFAAGQTAIAATPIRTGWHVLGTTTFQNFDPRREPPTTLRAGDSIRFVVAP
jgi:KipI family sensor histidine kinase inhibitor